MKYLIGCGFEIKVCRKGTSFTFWTDFFEHTKKSRASKRLNKTKSNFTRAKNEQANDTSYTSLQANSFTSKNMLVLELLYIR